MVLAVGWDLSSHGAVSAITLLVKNRVNIRAIEEADRPFVETAVANLAPQLPQCGDGQSAKRGQITLIYPLCALGLHLGISRGERDHIAHFQNIPRTGGRSNG